MWATAASDSSCTDLERVLPRLALGLRAGAVDRVVSMQPVLLDNANVGGGNFQIFESSAPNVGINRVDDPEHSRGYRLVGDVDYAGVSEVAGAITPVPGGVGPMTVAMLMKNTAKAARLINHL